MLNVGLWIGDPDVNAITRLGTNCSTNAAGMDPTHRCAMQRGQRMPINTQNTCLIREGLLSYYFVRMGYSIGGLEMGRFGDILPS